MWIKFIRCSNAQLSRVLSDGQVLMHDRVIGEIACGSASSRTERLAAMTSMPKINNAKHSEVLTSIENHLLFGCSVGYVDNHLLAAGLLHGDCSSWSRDKRLCAAAERLGVAFESLAH